jgi:hypothetical protein
MGKIEELMMEHSTQSIIEIGQIMEKFYNGQAGAIFRAIVNGRIKEQISQAHDVQTPSDRRLGRAEGMQLIQDDIELAIAQMHSLTQPQGEDNE